MRIGKYDCVGKCLPFKPRPFTGILPEKREKLLFSIQRNQRNGKYSCSRSRIIAIVAGLNLESNAAATVDDDLESATDRIWYCYDVHNRMQMTRNARTGHQSSDQSNGSITFWVGSMHEWASIRNAQEKPWIHSFIHYGCNGAHWCAIVTARRQD